jgi:hypothetical protein
VNAAVEDAIFCAPEKLENLRGFPEDGIKTLVAFAVPEGTNPEPE